MHVTLYLPYLSILSFLLSHLSVSSYFLSVCTQTEHRRALELTEDEEGEGTETSFAEAPSIMGILILKGAGCSNYLMNAAF